MSSNKIYNTEQCMSLFQEKLCMISLVQDGCHISVSGLVIFYPDNYKFHSASTESWYPNKLILINMLGLCMKKKKNQTHNHPRAIKYAWSVRNSNKPLCQFNTNTIRTNIRIWARCPRLPVTYDRVMKHRTHTVEASGAGKDRATDRIQTALKDRARWTNEERGKDESGQLKAI